MPNSSNSFLTKTESGGVAIGRDYLFLILGIMAFLSVFFTLTTVGGKDLRYVFPSIAFAVAIIYLWKREEKRGLLKHPIFYAIFAYVLVSYLMMPFSFDPQVSGKYLYREVLTGFFIFISVAVSIGAYRKEGDIYLILTCLAVICLVLVLVGFIAIIISNPNPNMRYLKFPLFNFRLHYNNFPWYVNLIFPFMVAGVLIHHRLRTRMLFGGLVLFSALVLLLNISRGGWVSLFTTIVLWLVFLVKKDKKFLPPAAIGCLLVFILLTCLWFFSPVFKARAISTGEDAKTITNRSMIWSAYIETIKKSPVVGWGYGKKIKPSVVAKGPSDGTKKNKGEPWWNRKNAHNLILEILFHQGLIGLLFFALFAGTTVFYMVKTIWFTGEAKEQLFFYAALCSFVSVFMVHGLIEIISFPLLACLASLSTGLLLNKPLFCLKPQAGS